MMNNRKMIYLDDAIDVINDLPNCPNGYSNTYDKASIISVLEEVPPAQPTLYGYDIRSLETIAAVLRKENMPPERVMEILTNMGEIIAIVENEFEESLRKAVMQCMI